MPLIAEPPGGSSSGSPPLGGPGANQPHVPTLAWPFRMRGGRLATHEQDSIEDVQQSVHAYLATERGERPLSPDFGLDDPTFGPGVNTARVAAEIMDSEDGRALVTIEASPPDARGHVSITVTVDLAE